MARFKAGCTAERLSLYGAARLWTPWSSALALCPTTQRASFGIRRPPPRGNFTPAYIKNHYGIEPASRCHKSSTALLFDPFMTLMAQRLYDLQS